MLFSTILYFRLHSYSSETAFMLPLFSFPMPNPTAKTFKWTGPIYMGIICIIVPWYSIWAKKWFFGPAGLVGIEQ
jgi:hypothetical protein